MNCNKRNYRIIHGSELLFIIGFTMLVFISLKLKDFKDIFLIFTERGPEIFCTKLWDEVPIISCLMWRGGLMVSKQQVHDWTMKMLSFFFFLIYMCNKWGMIMGLSGRYKVFVFNCTIMIPSTLIYIFLEMEKKKDID